MIEEIEKIERSKKGKALPNDKEVVGAALNVLTAQQEKRKRRALASVRREHEDKELEERRASKADKKQRKRLQKQQQQQGEYRKLKHRRILRKGATRTRPRKSERVSKSCGSRDDPEMLNGGCVRRLLTAAWP